MRIFHLCPRTTLGREAAVVATCLFGLCLTPLSTEKTRAQQAAFSRPLTAEQRHILDRAGEILAKASVSESERAVRLQVLKAVLTGVAIRPDDDYPEMRNPKYWTLSNDVFVLTSGCTPVDAISDLWGDHENDGVPIPRIRCYKYSSLALVQGHIQYFRETKNAAGLAVLNRLLGRRMIPQGLPNSGDDLLWKRRYGSDHLLPGDQVWVDNPFFERGRTLLRQQAYEQLLREGQSPAEATEAARTSTDALIAGEEGSNVFCLGDDKLIRGGFFPLPALPCSVPAGRERHRAPRAGLHAHDFYACPLPGAHDRRQLQRPGVPAQTRHRCVRRISRFAASAR